MGWFDKKSWKLRRKIKDLQADLKAAEAEGKFVVEDGVFFAELADMGEMTMMVFGTTDMLAAQEESVIRTFFDRNGFTVERVKIDRAHTGLDDAEILPPEEMTRAIGRTLKAKGYRMVDDSEHEVRADLPGGLFPLSALVRAITILFSERVQEIISTTRIKNNKEGNRLLHWLPKIIEALERKVDRSVIEEVRPAFEEAYDQFYRKIMVTRQDSALARPSAAVTEAPGQRDAQMSIHPQRADSPTREAAPVPTFAAPASPAPPRPLRPAEPQPAPATAAAPHAAPDANLARERDFAEALARMYKSLIRANSSRCVRNAQALLEEINQFFGATSSCIMVKVTQGHGLTIHAQAGRKLLWGEGGAEGFPISASILSACVRQRAVVTSLATGGDPSASMMAYQIDSTAAAPLTVNGEICGILYLDRRGGRQHFTAADEAFLARVASVFEEFPDLTMGIM
ncbi:MAG: GAF domain-containing protein [Candidatus Sumerlaeaceae bacterium]|nr:GAF domain-containing protein [Candidatus Sumerlaeaceae bacterium]